MKVSFDGIGESVVTFYNKELDGAVKGKPVKLSGNGEVSNCTTGDRFFGLCLAEENGFAAVQTGGYLQMKYSSTAPTVGFRMLAADGAEGVKIVATGGGEFLVVDVDTSSKIVGFML